MIMAFEHIVEEIIREAMKRGEFRDLAGRGRPLDLSRYFEAPEDVRVAQALLENAGVVPREVELLKEIWELRSKEAGCRDAEQIRKLRRQIAVRQLELDIKSEQYRRSRRGR